MSKNQKLISLIALIAVIALSLISLIGYALLNNPSNYVPTAIVFFGINVDSKVVDKFKEMMTHVSEGKIVKETTSEEAWANYQKSLSELDNKTAQAVLKAMEKSSDKRLPASFDISAYSAADVQSLKNTLQAIDESLSSDYNLSKASISIRIIN